MMVQLMVAAQSASEQGLLAGLLSSLQAGDRAVPHVLPVAPVTRLPRVARTLWRQLNDGRDLLAHAGPEGVARASVRSAVAVLARLGQGRLDVGQLLLLSTALLALLLLPRLLPRYWAPR